LEFQLNELEQANLQLDEDEILEEERTGLANYERIYTSLQDAYNALYGENRGLEWVNQAMTSLSDIEELDPCMKEKAEEVTNHYYSLESMAFDLRNKIDSLQYNPERLNEIESRLNELNRLKKKYGTTVNEMITYTAKIEEELEQIINKDF